MGLLARQEIAETGLTPSYSAAGAAGDIYPNDDRTWLVVKNGDASPHTATIQVQRANAAVEGFGSIVFADIAVAVPASEERWIKAPQIPYNDGDGKVHVVYDAVTSVTVGVFRMPRG